MLAVSGTAMLPAYSKGYISYDESFKSNGMDIRFSSNQCNAFLEKLYECKNTSIKILPIKQTLKLHTAWINLDYAVYNGKLDDKYADDKYSIVFSDINGDGVNDLIIQTGKKGAYGGPSYNIYLYRKGKFIYNRPLSQLTVGANSLFRANGNILTVGKTSGCCKYNKFTYNLHNDAVRLVRKETEVCESSSNKCQFKSKNF
ncbi:FG-GAP repeat protein [uncultured Neisseria sp.]|uniref:FG-GAP repeat protein n=1 Tax=uncultured Neisseria sp. TaxID=237778 RepID=UPI0026260202|nr:FG-GAP repeat protein [uncultured Neisseria sp.]